MAFSQEKEQHLSGKISLNEFLKTEHAAWYKNRYDSYEYDKKVLKKLKRFYEGQEVVAFLGTWCSDTQKQWPAFMKVWSEIADTNQIELVFVGLDKKIDAPEYQEFDIEFVPTFFILDQNGNVQGKIVERPEESLEEDLLGILRQ